MYNACKPPDVAGSDLAPDSSIASAGTELRRRSFPTHIIPAHIVEEQKKEAVVMVKEKELNNPPPYDGLEPQKLSFIQRHFYRSPIIKTDGVQVSQARRFSWLSRGSILSMILLAVSIVIIVLCAVFATISQQNHRKHASASHPSPVRQAILANFADPAIYQDDDGIWYAFATNNAAGILDATSNSSTPTNGSNVQIATSQDYINWTLYNSTHDPLPDLGAWVKKPLVENNGSTVNRGNVWAPEILRRPSDGKFVLFYSASTDNATRSHCVSAAISDSGVAGPYTPLETPITCPTEEGGAIDPVAFIDVDDTIWVAWKIDGNNVGHGGSCGNTVPPLKNTPIVLQKMESDGFTPDGEPIIILDRASSDGPLVEAPSIVRSDDGMYFLFYSSGCTRAPSYDLKYAWAHNVTGPYQRAEETLLRTGDYDLLAPGSVGVRKAKDGQVHMAFHARVTASSGRVRAMFTSRMTFHGRTVKLVNE